jgi:predicted DNA-binding transcriptional regulator AlpA
MMKLLTTTEVCDLLGISKTTLYRWNNLQQEDDVESVSRAGKLLHRHRLDSNFFSNKSANTLLAKNREEPAPNNFPRPFKIGRSYKWRDDEVIEWLESARVRG